MPCGVFFFLADLFIVFTLLCCCNRSILCFFFPFPQLPGLISLY